MRHTPERQHDPRARFPSEEEIYRCACEMFFRDRDAGRAFAHYWRLAETELLKRAAQRLFREARQ